MEGMDLESAKTLVGIVVSLLGVIVTVQELGANHRQRRTVELLDTALAGSLGEPQKARLVAQRDEVLGRLLAGLQVPFLGIAAYLLPTAVFAFIAFVAGTSLATDQDLLLPLGLIAICIVGTTAFVAGAVQRVSERGRIAGAYVSGWDADPRRGLVPDLRNPLLSWTKKLPRRSRKNCAAGIISVGLGLSATGVGGLLRPNGAESTWFSQPWALFAALAGGVVIVYGVGFVAELKSVRTSTQSADT